MPSSFRKPTEQGFTLIELLVVIIIIGILAAIAIPLFLDQRKLAVDASVKADVRNTVANIQTWQANTEANRTKAEANTGAYVTDGGKIAQTPGNSIGVSIDASGAATVCAYNSGGKTYLADSTAYVFNPATGQFTTGSCATGSTTGGTSGAAAGGSGSSTTTLATLNAEPSDPSNSMWQAGAAYNLVSNKGHGGVGSMQVNAYGYVGVVPSTALTVGKQYRVTAWIWSNNDGGLALSTRPSGGSGTDTRTTTTGQWEQVTATVTPTTVASGPGSAFNILFASYGGGTGYVDDVVVTQLN